MSPPQRRFGVGFPYLPGFEPELYRRLDLLDFVEVAPEMLCRQQRGGGGVRFELQPALVEEARATLGGLPVVVHGVELSMGTASGWNVAYLDMMDRFSHELPFAWHSEHLSFHMTVDLHGEPAQVGTPLPLPFTREAVAMLVSRVGEIRARYAAPFLIENAVHYLPGMPSDDGMDEVDFLNAVVDGGGCGLLLDLFNLHCNAIHHGFDARDAIARLRLDAVVEIHVAGGRREDGYLMDSHSERVPAEVWSLLEFTLPRAPNLRGVVYEVLSEVAVALGADAICGELARARGIWRRHHPPAVEPRHGAA